MSANVIIHIHRKLYMRKNMSANYKIQYFRQGPRHKHSHYVKTVKWMHFI